jgi:hypothetical protein
MYLAVMFDAAKPERSIPATTLHELIEEEYARTAVACERYGKPATLALKGLALLNTFVVSVDHDKTLVAALIFALRKPALLSFLSYARAHTSQGEFNARQLIEFSSLVAYMMAHPDFSVISSSTDGARKFITNKKMNDKIYLWMNAEHLEISSLLKEVKAQINDTASHASVFLTSFTFEWNDEVPSDGVFQGSFFDIIDDEVLMIYMLSIARVIMLSLELIRRTGEKHGGIVFAERFEQELYQFEREIELCRYELINTPK